jgi:transcriptional regulator with XRE-family HTH domain
MEKKTSKILDNIKRKRLEKDFSLLKLATEVGISHSHLYYIETKKVIPSIDVIVKIAQSLNIDIIELLE